MRKVVQIVEVVEGSPRIVSSLQLKDLRLDPPLGSRDAILRLGNGAICEVSPEAYEWIRIHRPAGLGGRFTRWAESSFKIAVMCFAATIVAIVLFFRVGIPLIADHSARILPPEIEAVVGQQVLDTLDRYIFDSSGMDAEMKATIRSEFSAMVDRVPDSPGYRIEFRSSRIGANAFALPGGIIIMTDELVELAQDPEEIKGVLAHELGHIEHKHGMRMAFQKAGYALTITFFLGDISSVLSIGAALPGILIETGHSRRFEREADLYAAYFLSTNDMSVEPMINLLERLTGSSAGEGGASQWLSTHPPVSERASLMRNFVENREFPGEEAGLDPGHPTTF